MDTISKLKDDDLSLLQVKAETKCVLEAFLKRSLSQDEGRHVGHVGRSYHDPKKYSYRVSHEDSKELFTKKPKKSDRKRSKEAGKDEGSRSPTFSEHSTHGLHGTWSPLHEEINRVEETKHGFKTSMKKLLRKPSQTKEKAGTPKEKNGSIHSKSRDSVDAILDDHGKGAAKGDSMKRPKSPNPLLACTVASSVISLPEQDQKQYELDTREKHFPGGTPKKLRSRSLSFKKLFKKKTYKENSLSTDAAPARPDYLPVQSCLEVQFIPETGRLNDSEIYSLAAKKLETLIKPKKLKSPQEPPKFFAVPQGLEVVGENNNVTTDDRPAVEDKDEVIRKLVALLQEQAVVINEKIRKDPFLRNTLNRMSYGSFFRLAEVFTSEAKVEQNEAGSSVSPELTKIALTMELTRKVAGINSHAVHTLMGYSLQYMDMFVPWLQKQGGWEKLVSDGDISDLQID